MWESRLPQIIAEADAKAALAVSKTGLDIEAGCKRRSRVDTGHMRNSWQWNPQNPLEGSVDNNVFYVYFNEYGTVHMAAQPMAVPSAEEARGPFMAAMAECYR